MKFEEIVFIIFFLTYIFLLNKITAVIVGFVIKPCFIYISIQTWRVGILRPHSERKPICTTEYWGSLVRCFSFCMEHQSWMPSSCQRYLRLQSMDTPLQHTSLRKNILTFNMVIQKRKGQIKLSDRSFFMLFILTMLRKYLHLIQWEECKTETLFFSDYLIVFTISRANLYTYKEPRELPAG